MSALIKKLWPEETDCKRPTKLSRRREGVMSVQTDTRWASSLNRREEETRRDKLHVHSVHEQNEQFCLPSNLLDHSINEHQKEQRVAYNMQSILVIQVKADK